MVGKMRLFAISDEAFNGIGFPTPDKPFVNVAWKAIMQKKDEDTKKEVLPHWPFSLCRRVDSAKVCVMPKYRVPNVGCTLQALSHNLALLPPIGEVGAILTNSQNAFSGSTTPLNILIVPFPFKIGTSSFKDGTPQGRSGKYFSVSQDWVPEAEEFAIFISDLVIEAEKTSEKVGLIVLPELALDFEKAKAISRKLAKRFSNLEGLITGVAEHKADGKIFNSSYSCFFADNGQGDRIESEGTQPKHHRWCLDRSQIERYGLAGVLNPSRNWWEQIDIGEPEMANTRLVYYSLLRPNITISTLICEDLARIDPAQGVLRAIAPNLVVALLADGSQLKQRWSARYATVLADDPGSSVLTLTSIGMVFKGKDQTRKFPGNVVRVENQDQKFPANIALWKEPGREVEELELPEGHHSLLLNCAFKSGEDSTMDGRRENTGKVCVSLAGVRPIKCPNLPIWLDDARILK